MSGELASLGKTLIVVGILLVSVGVGIVLLGKIPGFGRMPGDIMVRREHFSFYFPWVTCLVISGGISLFLWLLGKFRP